jgi:acetyl esterase/lipase
MRRLTLLLTTVLLLCTTTAAAHGWAGLSQSVVGSWYRTRGVERGVIVFVHGGAFMSGDDSVSNIHPALLAMRGKGWSVFSVRYEFVPTVTMEQQVLQVIQAVRNVRKEKPHTPIVLAGHSAGATLATRAALAIPGEIQGVIDIAGITDFATWTTQPRDVAFGFSSGYIANTALGCGTGGAIGESTRCSRRTLSLASATERVRPDAPLLYMAYGGRDQVVPSEQGRSLLAAYKAAGIQRRAWLDVSADSDHAVQGANRAYIEAFLTLCASLGLNAESATRSTR